MNSIIFDVLVYYLKPAFWIIAVWTLLRGHEDVGGGLIAGFLASFTVLLQVFVGGWGTLPEKLRQNFFGILLLGIFIALTNQNLFETGVAISTYAAASIIIGTLIDKDGIK